LLKTVFSIPFVQSSYKEEFSWKSAVAFRSSKWVVSRELGSASEAEKRWRYEFRCGVLTSWQQRDHGSWRISIAMIHYQETSSDKYCRGIAIVESYYQTTASGLCNRLWTLVCVCQ
jgi:hypothetical protein